MSTMIPLPFLAGSPGPLELLVILAVVLVLFGPRKLPGIARSIGRMLHELRKASDDFKSQLMTIDIDVKPPPDAPPPIPDTRNPTPGAGQDATLETTAGQTGITPRGSTLD